MKIFACQHCSQLLFFENTRCERCTHRLGYRPERGALLALEAKDDRWHSVTDRRRFYRFCANAEHDACNWLIAANDAALFCRACRHNRTIPDLTVPENLARWRQLELAKHRLFYTLLRLRLPLATREQDPEHGLAFDFLADPPEASGPVVMTGHAKGVITVALAEADSAAREKRREEMGEAYRTLLGHFRHEIAHYFWDVLVLPQEERLGAFRALFGDERQDYASALKSHYDNGPPADWRDRYISAYASSHPWEDFAETWAHYLHIVDALETASAFGMRIHPMIARESGLHADIDFDPHETGVLEPLLKTWLPLTFAVNSLNRSLGQPDLYPFVLTQAAIEKLGFVHALINGVRADPRPD